MYLKAQKSSGLLEGAEMRPHAYSNGKFVASETRLRKDYVYVDSMAELAMCQSIGLRIRMSVPDVTNQPSLVTPDSIETVLDAGDSAPIVETYVASFSRMDDLDGEALATSRREQMYLRGYLLGQYGNKCAICLRRFDRTLLMAAHIKRRAECSKEERLDFSNVAALMCSLGCDALFECGFISVHDGKVVCVTKARTNHVNERVKGLVGNQVENWCGSSEYYAWHIENVARK